MIEKNPVGYRLGVGFSGTAFQSSVFELACEEAAQPMSFLGADGRIFWVNRAACDLLQMSREELIGIKATDVFHEEDIFEETQSLKSLAALDGASTIRSERRVVRSDGTVAYGILSRSVILDEDGNFIGYFSQFQDLTERKDAEDRLEHLATHDPLTGLSNRKHFIDQLELAVERSNRTGGPLVLLFMDLDDFKSINDGLSHAAGDELLKLVGKRVKGCLRSGDSLARWGGDEFVILSEGADPARVKRIEERIKDAICGDVFSLRMPGGEEHRVNVGVSIGSYTSHAPHCRVEKLLHEADTNMYREKKCAGGSPAVSEAEAVA